jgi:hypothetical protein
MKKIFAAVVIFCGLWAANAQTVTTIIPLTNQAPFINTVVPSTNFTTIELSNVVTLLLTLQTNIEETLPVLDLIQSNAFVVSVGPTNGLRGIAPPLTNPVGGTLTPTGAASGSSRRVTSLAVRIGTNEFEIDAPTLQGLFILRQNLQQSLTVLQALNGTQPTNSPPPPTSLIPPPITNLPPTVTNFSPGPLTNTLRVPLTNMPPFVAPTTPSAF